MRICDFPNNKNRAAGLHVERDKMAKNRFFNEERKKIISSLNRSNSFFDCLFTDLVFFLKI